MFSPVCESHHIALLTAPKWDVSWLSSGDGYPYRRVYFATIPNALSDLGRPMDRRLLICPNRDNLAAPFKVNWYPRFVPLHRQTQLRVRR